MQRHTIAAAAAAAALFAPPNALAASDAEIAEIREQLKQLKDQYEKRIDALEKRLSEAEARANQAEAGAAETAASQVQSAAQASAGSAGASGFNPAISLILEGTYSNTSQDPATYRIIGFIPNGADIAPPNRSFSLGESELNFSANVDPYFRGELTMAITPDNDVEVEEAFVQTLSLGYGLGLKVGRFFSGIGYMNSQHPHAWDFVDAPLPQKAFLGNNYADDGVQLKWLAPTPYYLELGAELGRGLRFPGSDRNKNGIGSWAAFAHTGGDVGDSHSWRAGLSYLETSPQDRTFDDTDAAGFPVVNAFSGQSQLWIADFVWKWAPHGNARETSFKLQGEYYWRKEDGTLSFDTLGLSGIGTQVGAFSADQSGWYLQAVYQFMPRWQVGVRYDRLDFGNVSNNLVLFGTGGLTAADFPVLAPHNPEQFTAMLDFSFSEFSLLRVQYQKDEARLGASDNQLFVQYIMTLGAHGAHKY
jgi:hypothetical protein